MLLLLMNLLGVLASLSIAVASFGSPQSDCQHLIHITTKTSAVEITEIPKSAGLSKPTTTFVAATETQLHLFQKRVAARALPFEQTLSKSENPHLHLEHSGSKSSPPPTPPQRKYFSALLSHLNVETQPRRKPVKVVQVRTIPPKKSTVYIDDYFTASRVIAQTERMHYSLREYFENSDFLKFAEDYGQLRLFFSRISAHMTEMERTGNLYLWKVQECYKKMFIIFRLFEIQCAWILKGGSLRSFLNCYDDSPEGNYLRQNPEIHEVCTKVMKIEGHLRQLFAADRDFKFVIDDPRFGRIQDLDEDFSDAEIDRIENAFGKFSDFKSTECFQAENPTAGTSAGIEGVGSRSEAVVLAEQRKRVLCQYMNLRYMIERLRFIRRQLAECEKSAILGTRTFTSWRLDMLAICTEVEVQLAAMRLPDARSKKLLEYLLSITIYRIKEVERKTKKSDSDDDDDTYSARRGRSSLGNYHLKEAEGVEIELRSTLSRLKKLQKRCLASGAQGIEDTLSKIWTRWSEFSAYINDRQWCWTAQETLVIQFKSAEISDILSILQSFAEKAVFCKDHGLANVESSHALGKNGQYDVLESSLVELIKREYPALRAYLDRLLHKDQ